MSELLTSLLKEVIQEAAPEIAKELSGGVRNGKQGTRMPVYQSRLLKEDELTEYDDEDSEHPEHEGACVRSPEGVEGDSDEGEYQPSLKNVPTEGDPDKPSVEAKKAEMPENLLKSDAPPMQRRENLCPRYQVTPQELRKSIITAEILGKPLALRKKYR